MRDYLKLFRTQRRKPNLFWISDLIPLHSLDANNNENQGYLQSDFDL